MSRELIGLASPPRAWEFEGRTYLVHKLRMRDAATLRAWIGDHLPHPLDVARRHIEGLPVEMAKHVWDRALKAARDWPPALGSVDGRRMLDSPEGQAMVLYVLLSRTVSGMTIDDARALADRMDDEDWERLWGLISPGETGDPKAAGATTRTGVPTPN